MGVVYQCDTCGAICDGVSKRVYGVQEVIFGKHEIGPPYGMTNVVACEDCVPDPIKDAIQRQREYAEQQFRERLEGEEKAAGRLGTVPGPTESKGPPV